MSEVQIPRFNVHAAPWEPLPEFGGQEAILFRSPDGQRVAATFKVTGKYEFEWTFDEMIYVVDGSVVITHDGGETIELTKGDMAYLSQGAKGSLEGSENFQAVTCFISDAEISWR